MSRYKLMLVAKGSPKRDPDGERYDSIEKAKSAASSFLLGADDKVLVLDTHDHDRQVDIVLGG